MKTKKMIKHNVASGPAVYPKEVLEKISKGIVEYENSTVSILEITHRSELFFAIRDELISLTKELLNVPDEFSVMYLQGGGRQHLAQIPMNFLSPNETVQFIDSGYWSSKAIEYTKKYGEVEVITSSKNENYLSIPKCALENLNGKYLQYCSNNTIYGTQFAAFPKSNIPAVVDMSSEIFSRKIDFENVELIMACAQKNIGPAGLSLLIVKNDFLAIANQELPAVFSYSNQAAKNSNYNTPPVFQICASLEMLRWVKAKGGVDFFEADTNQRANFLYNAIDKSELVENNIAAKDRSVMNIVFDAVNKKSEQVLNEKFANAQIKSIGGHKARGGFRVSNYLAQSQETIELIGSLL